MCYTYVSRSNTLTIEQVLSRLKQNEIVDGLLTMGSTATAALSPASDYDLLVVLAEMPLPLEVGLTVVDGRLADVVFTTTSDIERIARDEAPIPGDSFDASLAHWLQTGTIVVDRSGWLARAQKNVGTRARIAPLGEAHIYATWFSVNYNVAQARRMVRAVDPAYVLAIDVRLLYSLLDVWTAYFQMRRLLIRGEKAQVRYLMEHDPRFLERFQSCLHEPDRERKITLYAELAAEAVAPSGGLWEAGATAIQLRTATVALDDTVHAALAFWKRLIGDAAGEEQGEPARH